MMAVEVVVEEVVEELVEMVVEVVVVMVEESRVGCFASDSNDGRKKSVMGLNYQTHVLEGRRA